jgi:hypothetical protein
VPDAAPENRYDPPRRLVPSLERDRPWRRGVVLAGSAVMLLVVLVLAAATTATWWNGRQFAEVPATTALGTPASLQLTSRIGDVRVQPSEEVEQVTLSLVDPGTTVPAPAGQEVRARLERSGTDAAPTVTVSQPESFSAWPGADESRDVLVLVPAGHVLDLDLRSDVGDVVAAGDFGSLAVRSDVGDVHLGPVSASKELGISTDIGGIEAEIVSPGPAAVDVTSTLGDVSLQLPADASGPVGVVSELGDVRIALAGTSTWQVEIRAELGEVSVDPDLHGTGAEAVGTLTAVSETGDVTHTRGPGRAVGRAPTGRVPPLLARSPGTARAAPLRTCRTGPAG